MKRSAELRDLSEEHHYGLVASRQLRLAAEATEPVETAIEAFLVNWREEILPHFATEEAVLLPHLARVLGPEDSLIVRTLAEHAALRVAVLELGAAPEPERRFLATRAAELLHNHIRFEERVLFPEIERALDGEPLGRLGDALKHSTTTRTCMRKAGS
ncbi:MAG: Hemerythrin cation binding region [Armatimonadetes bacterium]|jgi:hemerythrin-like domain-containing protein|nr:Hemerythrin cation binding region [Armatimonadota bacterium]